jgi:hypothetical protein
MSLSRRLRNIAKSQINALKDRLDRVDAEDEFREEQIRAEVAARRSAQSELLDPTDLRPARRSPEEIAAGIPASRPATSASRPISSAAPVQAQAGDGPLSKHYRRLGVEDGADLSAVDAAFIKVKGICDPALFPEGSPDREKAEGVFKLVEESYDTLRDALDPTAGRFDKLEL